jgi:hypothetical protein
MTEPLSPSAQAVLDAFLKAPCEDTYYAEIEVGLAAALVAAADQVVPEQGCQIYGLTQREDERQQVRDQLLSIAAELKAHS